MVHRIVRIGHIVTSIFLFTSYIFIRITHGIHEKLALEQSGLEGSGIRLAGESIFIVNFLYVIFLLPILWYVLLRATKADAKTYVQIVFFTIFGFIDFMIILLIQLKV